MNYAMAKCQRIAQDEDRKAKRKNHEVRTNRKSKEKTYVDFVVVQNSDAPRKDAVQNSLVLSPGLARGADEPEPPVRHHAVAAVPGAVLRPLAPEQVNPEAAVPRPAPGASPELGVRRVLPDGVPHLSRQAQQTRCLRGALGRRGAGEEGQLEQGRETVASACQLRRERGVIVIVT